MTRGYRLLQGVTSGYKGSNRLKRVTEVTGCCKGLQRITRGYKGLQRVKIGYRGLQGIKRGYRLLHGGYKGSNKLNRLQEVTGGCKL